MVAGYVQVITGMRRGPNGYALERNDSRVQCKGRAQMRHRVCRVRAAACQIHRVERCQAVC